MAENANNNGTATPWEVTESQAARTAAIDTQLEDVRSQEIGTLKETQAIKKIANSYSGEENAPTRLELVAALAGIDPATVDPAKASVTNLNNLLVARYFGEAYDFDFTPKKKEDTSEPTETEVALASIDLSQKITVSKNIAAMTKSREDLNFITSAIHAAWTYCLAILQSAKHKLPPAAANMVSYLIGASGGSTDPFTLTDKAIAESSKVSERTVQRARDALIKWIEATGIGIVDIQMSPNTGTTYKVNVLEMSTNILQSMLTGTSPELLSNVATLAGKFLEESGEERLKKQLPADVFEKAKQLAHQLTDAVNAMPTPTLQLSEGRLNSAQAAVAAKFENLSGSLDESLQNANQLGLTEQETALNDLAVEMRTARERYEKDGTPANFETFEATIKTANQAIVEASKGNVEKAQAARRETLAATGDHAQAATAEIESLATDTEIANLQEQAVDRYNQAVFTLAAIAERADDPDLRVTTFQQCQDTLMRAFHIGAYADSASA